MFAQGSAGVRLLALVLISLACLTAHARDTREDQVLVVDIPRSDFFKAAMTLAHQIGVAQMGVDPEIDQDLMTRSLQGTYTFDAAMRELLTPLGLTYSWLNDRALYIGRARPSPPTVQTTPPPSFSSLASREELESIIVIGTYASSWMHEADEKQVLNQHTIEAFGVSTLPELLRYLTQVPFSSSSASSQFGDQYPNLRGLGPASTLVLINGRRVAPSATAYNNGAFDLNALPLTAVQRIEVLPNSPSVLIGSEASGGIINIVLQDEMKEPVVSVNYGSSDGGAAERRASLGFGSSSALHHSAVTLDVFDRQPLFGDTRGFSRNQDFRSYGGLDYRAPVASPGNVYSATGTNLPGLNAAFAAIPFNIGAVFLAPSDFVSSAGQLRRESLARFNSIVTGSSRVSLLGQGDWSLSSTITAFGEVQLTERKNRYVMGPPMLASVLVPASNPYNPFGVPVRVSTLLTGLPPRSFSADAKFWRGVGGLRWTEGDWNAELTLTRTRDAMRLLDQHELDPTRLISALSAIDPMTALNPFSEASGSEALLRSLLAPDAVQSFSSDGMQLYARVAGTLMSLPAGGLRIHAGGEWREESAQNLFLPMAPQRATTSAFAELSIPVIGPAQSVSGAQELSVSIGGREDHYDTFAPKFTSQYRIAWHSMPGVLIRATYSDTYRTPSLLDLYSPSRTIGFITTLDPLRHNSPTAFSVVSGGNPNLVSTSGHTWSAGVEWNSRATDDLHLSLTYWQATILKDIFPISVLAMVGREDLFPGRVQRAAPTATDLAAGVPGTIQNVDVRPGNFGFLEASGIDWNTSAHFIVGAGRLTPQLSASWNSRFRRQLTRDGLLQEELGVASELGTVPRWRVISTLRWETGPLVAFVAARFTSRYADATNNIRTGSVIPSLTTMDAQLSLSLPSFLHHSSWDGLTWTVGAQDLFNTFPHFAQVGRGSGYDVTQGDLRGRFWYMRFAKTF